MVISKVFVVVVVSVKQIFDWSPSLLLPTPKNLLFRNIGGFSCFHALLAELIEKL